MCVYVHMFQCCLDSVDTYVNILYVKERYVYKKILSVYVQYVHAYIYIYMYIYMCVCVCVRVKPYEPCVWYPFQVPP